MNKRCLSTWFSIAAAVAGLVHARPVDASCVSSETLDDAVSKAPVIFVATILEAKLDSPQETLEDRHAFRTSYKFVIARTIRGNPQVVAEMCSTQLYHGVRERKWTMAGERSWSVGDNVLVIADGGPSIDIGACSWSAPYEEMREEVAKRHWTN